MASSIAYEQHIGRTRAAITGGPWELATASALMLLTDDARLGRNMVRGCLAVDDGTIWGQRVCRH